MTKAEKEKRPVLDFSTFDIQVDIEIIRNVLQRTNLLLAIVIIWSFILTVWLWLK